MRFYDIDKKRPKNGQWCLIKEKFGNEVDLSLWPQCYWDDCGFMYHPDVVAWAPMPDHISVNPDGWKSEYRGDELPSKSCWCLVCDDKSRNVFSAYFDVSKQRFLAYPDVVAFMIM